MRTRIPSLFYCKHYFIANQKRTGLLDLAGSSKGRSSLLREFKASLAPHNTPEHVTYDCGFRTQSEATRFQGGVELEQPNLASSLSSGH